MGSPKTRSYFSELTWFKVALYTIAVVYFTLGNIVAFAEPFLDTPCEEPKPELDFPNVAYAGHLCRHVRYKVLLGLNREECIWARRLFVAVMLGALIGWERRQGDRPAGIRTMSMVSLGSCLFTINSTYAFLDGPMTWDSSRVSAAIPSGVGFLGAGLIFKKEERSAAGDSNHVVHGLTTAASLWISAAVGVAVGGGLYFPATFGVTVLMLVLRFAPRGTDDTSEDDDSDGDPEAEISYESLKRNDYSTTDHSEAIPLSAHGKKKSFRARKSLASDD
ncbi:unnamed protein product [Cylindrotheca closterium]|uniref:MgtC/SapB/SrpB/YhiD N-terminal domain-containing protein n=1 Tax=Cylindrotheca closterium TaxID=2856 RepID=A0AAD2FR27_9STRA|nr:unnamed protein product [Cylindrotheca closterium]